MSEQDTTTTSGPPVQVGPGGVRPHVQRMAGPCLIVRLSSPGETPERLAVCELGESPGYAMDRETGLLRVWDREHTHLVPPDQVVLLRVTNAIRRG